jgi:hypothetical protein
MSLPDSWVERIFGRLLATYGRDFTARWEGIDGKVVKADWAYVLRGYEREPDRLAYALDHMPAKPPNVIDFRAIADSAPTNVRAPTLPNFARPRSPRPDELAALRQLRDDARAGALLRKPSRQWAYDIVAQHERGEFRGCTGALRMAQEVVAAETGRQFVPRETQAELLAGLRPGGPGGAASDPFDEYRDEEWDHA